MSRDTERIFHGAALEIAQTIHEDDPDFVERADAVDGAVHIAPDLDWQSESYETERDAMEVYAEAIVDDYPFSVSEWWHDRLHGEDVLVLAHYDPMWGGCSKEQLEQYDEFVDSHRESTVQSDSDDSDDFVEERGGYA